MVEGVIMRIMLDNQLPCAVGAGGSASAWTAGLGLAWPGCILLAQQQLAAALNHQVVCLIVPPATACT